MTKRNPFAPPSWHTAVAAGDFSALPDPLRWDETIHLALLIDNETLSSILAESTEEVASLIAALKD